MRFTTVLVVALFLVVGVVPGAAAQQVPTRAIVNVTGQLYRAQNNNHYTVFLVTREGIDNILASVRDAGRIGPEVRYEDVADGALAEAVARELGLNP